jgi:hypothetical protein
VCCSLRRNAPKVVSVESDDRAGRRERNVFSEVGRGGREKSLLLTVAITAYWNAISLPQPSLACSSFTLRAPSSTTLAPPSTT